MEICDLCRPNNAEQLPFGLPPSTKHILCENIRPLPGSVVEGSFYTVLRAEGNLAEDAVKWLKEYSNESRTVWRVQCAHRESGRKNVFKTEYRCQHNTRHKRSDSAKRKPSLILKNTECPAKLVIIIKRVPKRSRSCDKHVPSYPMIIKFKNEHNHSTNCEAAMKHRDVLPEVRMKFEKLFKEQKHSPGSALITHIHDLHQELGDKIFDVLTDRSKCPDKSWCYSLYYKIFNNQYRDKELDNQLGLFESTLKSYSKELNSDCVRYSSLGGEEFSCAIITPLMRRNHKLNPNAKGVCVVDSSIRPEKDKASISLHIIFCDSEAGGLPLGILLASSEEDNVLQEACSLYHSMLDTSMHFGQGPDGPKAFLMGDCPGLRNSLAAVFPSAEVLLSVVHLAVGVWRVVCSQNCGIPAARRSQMMHIGKKLLRAKSAEELDEVLEIIENGPIDLSQQFGRYQEYLRELHSVRKIWSPCIFNQTDTARAALNSTNIARDVTVYRLVSYGLLQAAHFIFTRLDAYYGKRIEDVVNGREIEAIKRRFLVGRIAINREDVTQMGPGLFKVVDGTKQQDVDALVGCCTCSVLNTSNAPCHHQLAVLLHFGRNTFENKTVKSHTNPVGKISIYEIATGCKVDLPEQWFNLKNDSASCMFSENIHGNVIEKFNSACFKMRQIIQRNPETFANAVNSLDNALNSTIEENFTKEFVKFSEGLETCND